MSKALLGAFGVCVGLMSTVVQAAELKVMNVVDNVYAIVGPHEQRNPTNFANNATFGVVVTDEGVLLVDPGGSYKGAEQVHAAIKTITDKPVKIVINSGGQDHRWLGNGYFKALGARIIASSEGVEDHKARTNDHFFRLTNFMGKDALAGTEAVYADETFDEALDLSFGGESFEIRHVGPAHTLGDSFIWMPEKRVMFTGDIVYVGRMLGIGPARASDSWVEVFQAMAAYNPKYIVPGHGAVTDLKRATAETYDYLMYLRTKIGEIIDSGGVVEQAIAIDQSQFEYLVVSEQIAKRNAQNVFMQMEFE
ncbi:MBL fold metallo-hydrolase [Magnetovibrio sp. PR-2]|uniref:MBL fold metallo-hydrolase n=1 Tax=Magnetovibrio sp. PR-2 TaxID=3120356 RepID=UPI002FCE1535